MIKSDQSLRRLIDVSRNGRRTISLLAQLMHENDYRIVAEGIETAQQAQTVRETGVDRIQGFYYAKPLPEEELLQLL